MSPNEAEILNYLTLITAPWKQETISGELELRCIYEGRKPNTVRFDIQNIHEAVQHALVMNSMGLNIYACVNPVDGRALSASKAATDKDILRAHFAFADCDAPGIAENLIINAPKYDLCVVTGKQPYLRCHYYWQLIEAVTQLSDWINLQKMLAATHATDPHVCNPSRVMRVAGTIAYPNGRKKQLGYTNELTHLKRTQ